MVRTWGKIAELTWAERRTLVRAGLLLPVIAIGLRGLGFRRWHRLLASAAPSPAGDSAVDPATTARLVNAMARRLWNGPSCLQRSLCLWFLLRRDGVACALQFGVRRRDGRFEAHAWVERDGRPINDDADVRERFEPFDRAILPAGADLEAALA